METLILARNAISRLKYQCIIKPIFFQFNPETIHNIISRFLEIMGSTELTRSIIAFCWGYRNKMLEQTVLGIKFKNPIGLSAGFDKDARLIGAMPALGFGFTEVGSITAKPYGGNQKPRLYRLPEHKTLRVNYGLKNFGAEVISKNLSGKSWGLPVGISIAKTNIPETSEVQTGIADYFFTYQAFKNIGDYFTVNISCPNTCETRPIFAEPENLDLLLQKLFSVPKTKPVFVKISPDLEEAQLNGILEVCRKHPVDGFVCTNLTKTNAFNHAGRGGFSGKAVQNLSDDMIRKVYKYFNGQKTIIGVGGIFTAEDAYRKIKAGASLLELITGMIYEGPQVISEINQGLVKLLQKDGYKNISEAIGKDLFETIKS